MLAEPVNRKRPALRSLSTDCLMARRSSGALCTSSMMTKSNPRTKASRVAAGCLQHGVIVQSDILAFVLAFVVDELTDECSPGRIGGDRSA
jgi:hypothetical protein